MCKFCKKWEQQRKLTSVVEEFTSYYLVYAEKTQQQILKISKETIFINQESRFNATTFIFSFKFCHGLKSIE